MMNLMDWFKNIFQKNRIYLDYAAATPMLWAVQRAMWKYLSREFYNPNAIYREGVKVKKEVEEYRTKIARILGVSKDSIIFTSGGTEANTLAVRGVGPGKVIIEPDSHPSVTDAAKKTSSTKIVLISSPTTDNSLGRKIREERKNLPAGRQGKTPYPLLHIDASQSAQYFNVSLESLACDLLTLDAAKIYGPKGIGALVVRRGVELDLPPQGTPAVPLIAGFAKALEIAARDRERESKRLSLLSGQFSKAIQENFPEAIVTQTLPNIVNVFVPGILPEFLVLALDRAGLMVSAGPACNAHKPEPPETPVRFSLGRFTTEKELNKATEILCRTVENMIKS